MNGHVWALLGTLDVIPSAYKPRQQAIVQWLRALLAAALLSASANVALAYPFPDVSLGSLDVDKAHAQVLGPHGEFDGIPAKEANACWLASVASVVGKLAGDDVAQAQNLYRDWVDGFAGNIPTKTGREIADYIDLKPESYEARAVWFSSLGLTEEEAQNDFEVLINQALEGDSIILSNLRVLGQNANGSGHATVLDGWSGLVDPDAVGELVSIVDSDADWLSDANIASDSTTLTLTFEEHTVTVPGSPAVKRWLPVLTYWPQSASAPVFADYVTGFVSVSRLPEPSSISLVVLSLASLLGIRGCRRSGCATDHP